MKSQRSASGAALLRRRLHALVRLFSIGSGRIRLILAPMPYPLQYIYTRKRLFDAYDVKREIHHRPAKDHSLDGKRDPIQCSAR